MAGIISVSLKNNISILLNAVRLLPYYTYEDFWRWEGRWELIDGIPFAMNPAPTLGHQWLLANIIFELKRALKETKCKQTKQ